MAENIQAVTDGNFEAEVLTASNSQPVMVDFWAEWCRPCHMLAPTVAEIAHDYAGKLKVMKLNVDEAMNSAGKYRVQGIPTLLLFKNGQVVEQIVGAVFCQKNDLRLARKRFDIGGICQPPRAYISPDDLFQIFFKEGNIALSHLDHARTVGVTAGNWSTEICQAGRNHCPEKTRTIDSDLHPSPP